jgi:hypothetical protein
VRIACFAHLVPPSPDAFDGKLRRVTTEPHINPTFIAGWIINAIRACFAFLGIRKIIRIDFGRLTLRFPYLPRLGEIAHILLLLRVYRDHRLLLFLKPFDLSVNELELGISIRMVYTLLRFAVNL